MPLTNLIAASGGTADRTPDAINFTDCCGVNPSIVIISNSITPTGYNAPSPVCISSGSFCISGKNTWCTGTDCILPGCSISVCTTSNSGYLANCNVLLCLGCTGSCIKATWATQTRAKDETPDAFCICCFTEVTKSAQCCFCFTPTSYDCAAVSTSGPVAISVASGGYGAGPCCICTGQVLCVKLCASSASSTTCIASVTIGTCTGTGCTVTKAWVPSCMYVHHTYMNNSGGQGGQRYIYNAYDNTCTVYYECTPSLIDCQWLNFNPGLRMNACCFSWLTCTCLSSCYVRLSTSDGGETWSVVYCSQCSPNWCYPWNGPLYPNGPINRGITCERANWVSGYLGSYNSCMYIYNIHGDCVGYICAFPCNLICFLCSATNFVTFNKVTDANCLYMYTGCQDGGGGIGCLTFARGIPCCLCAFSNCFTCYCTTLAGAPIFLIAPGGIALYANCKFCCAGLSLATNILYSSDGLTYTPFPCNCCFTRLDVAAANLIVYNHPKGCFTIVYRLASEYYGYPEDRFVITCITSTCICTYCLTGDINGACTCRMFFYNPVDNNVYSTPVRGGNGTDYRYINCCQPVLTQTTCTGVSCSTWGPGNWCYFYNLAPTSNDWGSWIIG